MAETEEEFLELPDEMPLPEALQLGIRLHRENRLEGARTIYERILEVAPEQPDALHYLGVLLHRLGRSDEGEEKVRRSVALVPEFFDFRVNFGNVLVERGRIEEAEEQFERARDLAPERAEVWNNLGTIYRERGRRDDAVAAYEKAHEIDPKLPSAINNLGTIFQAEKDYERAARYFCLSIGIAPKHPDGYKLLGLTYYAQEMFDAAAEVFAKWIEADPENPAARHHHAACSGENVPGRASDEYVAMTFDSFAGSFEEKLQSKLHYRAPQLVQQVFEARVAAPAGQYDIFDAGCGTGLCGPLLAPYAKSLVGVDLSKGMLQQAATKDCYDELVLAELTAFAKSRVDAFDVVISADTLCYFGALEEVMAAFFAALRSGGTLVFTVEELTGAAPDTTTILGPSGRYRHSEGYVRSVLAELGFRDLEIQRGHLRSECQEPVAGLIVGAGR